MLKTVNPWQILILCACLLTSSCTYEVLPAENACTDVPQLLLVSAEDTDCGEASGAIVVEATSLTDTPLKYSINGGNENVTGLFENLSAATYSITVENIDGCASTLDVEIKNESGINISVEASASNCGSNTGKITIAANGGEEPYRFKLNEGNFQTENIFESLQAGNYTIVAEDATGCSIVQTAAVSSNISFSAVQSIIQTNCVSASCHGGNVSPDFRQATNITGNAGRIKSRTEGKSMPPSSSGKSLTNQEIAQIACWVNDGANP